MERFKAIIFNATVGSDFITAARELKSVLEKHGLPSATVASIYDKNWTAVFDQECGGVVEVYSQDMVRTKGLLSAGSIRTLGLRTVAQLVVNGGTRDPARSTTVDITVSDKNAPLCQRQATDTPVNIDFLQWDCDYVFWHLSDYSTSFLNAASQQHPSALTSFIMDVSQLSPVGLSFVPEILRRSSLEHLTVMCTLFHPSLANYFARLLDSVQWCILKSLILSGDKIDEWCQLWPSPISPRLLSFQITGWSSAVQMLSHSSALFIHQLIFSSPLVELHFENVQFQEKCDWVLVINSMDLCPLRTLGLGESSIMQFLDVPDAVDLIVSRSEETQLRSQGQHLVLPLFTLDVTTLPQSSFAHVEGILSHCILEKLVVKCNSIDLSNSDPVAKVLDSVQWSLLEYLRLSGDDINKWVQLLAKVDTPRLNTLQIWGTKTVQQELSHSGVLFVERLIVTSSLVRLHFKDVLLQDKNDWVLLIEKMDYANLKNFFLGDGSHEQFIATPDAVKLKNSKLFPWVPESWDVEQFCTDEE
ncbi:hypothetical protein BGZ92_011644 [Podila epicladia]|nr:hypothetical protein BGZ92_011644 [Podila epicladia]